MFGSPVWKSNTQPQPNKCGWCLGNGNLFKQIKILNVHDKQIGYTESQTIKCEHCKGTGKNNSAANSVGIGG